MTFDEIWIPRVGTEGAKCLRRYRRALLMPSTLGLALAVAGSFAFAASNVVLGVLLAAGMFGTIGNRLRVQKKVAEMLTRHYGVPVTLFQVPPLRPSVWDAWTQRRGAALANVSEHRQQPPVAQ